MEDCVFVYGTLRKDAGRPVRHALARGWSFLGYGSVPGELYDFGAYPGAVSAAGDGRVRGELYRIPDPRIALPLLDEYEGCGPHDETPHEFEREMVEVELDDGSSARAWVYWYRPSPLGRRLPSGDYLERTGDSEPGG